MWITSAMRNTQRFDSLDMGVGANDGGQNEQSGGNPKRKGRTLHRGRFLTHAGESS